MKQVRSMDLVKKHSEMHYFDDLMNPVTREMATVAVFREFDEKGNLIFEAQGFID